MDRPVFVSLLAVAVVAAAGLGALNAGIDTRGAVDDSGPASSVESVSERTPTPKTGTTATPVARAAGTHSSKRSDSATSVSSADDRSRAAVGRYPPGTSPAGIENARELLGAHTASLGETGFVVRSRANATVLETGMRIDATTRGGAHVAAGAKKYHAYRTDAAGPLQRRTEGWYDGSIEHHRRVGEFGSVDESTRESRSVGELAGRPLLAPHLRGGAFEQSRVVKTGEKRRFVFTASAVTEERTVIEGLPEATTEVRSYEGRVVVDSVGRIRSFSATVEYVIGGERESHHLEYDLTRVGTTTVERPEWVDVSTSNATGDRSDASQNTQAKPEPGAEGGIGR